MPCRPRPSHPGPSTPSTPSTPSPPPPPPSLPNPDCPIRSIHHLNHISNFPCCPARCVPTPPVACRLSVKLPVSHNPIQVSSKTGIGELRRFMLMLTAFYCSGGLTRSVVEFRVDANRQNVLAAFATNAAGRTFIGLDPIEPRSQPKSNKESYMISLQPGVANGLRRPQRFLLAELMRTGFSPPLKVGLHHWPRLGSL